jgi:hypothetical protein
MRPWRRALQGYGIVLAAVVAWWSAIPPSNDRNWQPDVAVLPSATIEGDWKILLSGYLPECVYERGGLNSSLPFSELRRRSLNNERARAADQDPAFSLRIREGLPERPGAG